MMALVDSDDEDVLYAKDNRSLIGGKRYKNLDDVMNGEKKDKRKLRKTLALCVSFLCLGLCIALLGPTLLSLKEHLNISLDRISLVFTGRGLGYFIGAMLGGVLFDLYNPLMLIGVSLLLCGVGMISSPYMTSLMLLGLATSLTGLSMGFLDTGANLVCLRMWGEKRSSSMLQALHFSFALGAFISPLLAAPFLGTPDMINATTVHTTLQVSLNPSTQGFQNGSTTMNVNSSVLSGATTPGATTGKTIGTTKLKTTPTTIGTTSTTPKASTSVTTLETKTGNISTTNGTTSTSPKASTFVTPIGITTGHGTTMQTTIEKINTTPMTQTEPRRKLLGLGFKSTREVHDGDHNNSNSDGNHKAPVDGDQNEESLNDQTTNSESKSAPEQHVEHFQTAYVIIGSLVLICALLFFYLFITQPKNEPNHTADGEVDQSAGKQKKCTFRKTILTLLFAFYFLYVGGEITYGGFIATFAVKSRLHFTKDRASHVAAFFWGMFALGRGLAICIASVISPLKMVVVDLIFCLGASATLSFFAEDSEAVFWLGSGLLGLSMASLFPSGIAWLQQYTQVTGTAASILIVGCALGEMVVPMVTGVLMDTNVGPVAVMYQMLGISILCALIFFYVIWLSAERGETVDSKPAEINPAVDLFRSVEEAIPIEDLSISYGNNNRKQMKKQLVPSGLKKKTHKA